MTTNKDFTALDLTAAKVLVVGDVMLDQYWHGGTSRISPEAPVPVVKINKTDNRPGGAANVVNNLLALGCNAKLLGIVGNDPAADILQQLLSVQHAAHEFVVADKFSTIVKLRVLCRHQQMIRLDHEEDPTNISNDTFKELYDLFARDLSNYKAVILSDYAKGVLVNPQPFIQASKALGITSVVDPKSHDLSIYRGASIIKPNLSEFEACVGKSNSLVALEEKARNAIKINGFEAMIITRGSQGMTIIPADRAATHIPAYGAEVYDVTGAGDTVIAVLTASIAAGLSLERAAHLSAVAAGIVVGKVGTSSVTLQELRAATETHKELPTGVAEEQTLKEIIKLAQARGEKIVFVNGCYDLIHYGHIRYLEEAKALGDRLVVGVNSDASVKRLKGESRPMYSLAQRMEVLAGLKAVDWVVAFDEDTPGRLVEALNPNIIAKGDEHFKSIEEMPASEGVAHVLKNGGSVHLIKRTADVSSSKMIEFLTNQ
jgi:D-beta-D-heptose 7-phosphate kinase/D-beta-D-heptose 1-phosphate adenosyltransferase